MKKSSNFLLISAFVIVALAVMVVVILYGPKINGSGNQIAFCEQVCNSKGYETGYCGGSFLIEQGLSPQRNGCKGDDFEVYDYDSDSLGCGASSPFVEIEPGSGKLAKENWTACCCSGVSATWCAKESEKFTDQDKLCCAGLERAQFIDGFECKNPDRTCAENGEMVFNERSSFGAVNGPKKCCDPDAGIKHVAFSDGGAAAGYCIKDFDKNCGNGICGQYEDVESCPWDCK